VTTPSEIDPTCPGCVLLMKRLVEIEAVVAKQGAEIERLKARKPKTSRTSSKPPSSDAPWSKAAHSKRDVGREEARCPAGA